LVLQEAVDFKISNEILRLLENEYNEQQGGITTPKVDIENLKTANQFPPLKTAQSIPLTMKSPLKVQVQGASGRVRNRNEAVNRATREEIIRWAHKNECYVMQAEGDFGNSFSSQFSNLDISGFDQDKSILREPKSQKPLISTRIDFTRGRTANSKKEGEDLIT